MATGVTTDTGGAGVDNQYFFEDEIFRIDRKGRVKFGLVIETCDSYSGDEDDEFDDVLSKGEVRIAWYPEGEDVQSERAIGLADRTLMPGDVVRRLLPGKDTQRGYCRGIRMHADVRVLGTKYVIQNVMAERLRLIANWQRDSAVCLDSWVGSTKDFEEKAVLRSASGARIEISSSDFYSFKDLNSRNTRGIFNPQAFYPGNVVIGRLPSMDNVKLLTPNIPLHTNKKGKPLTSRFTIESVFTDSVWVHWQCKALSEETNIQSSALEQPSPIVTGDDLKRLKRLNLFEACMLQINDRNYLKYSKFDTVIKKSQWEEEQALKFKAQLSKLQKEENQAQFVHTGSGSAAGTGNASHHFEKSKKKLGLLSEADKSSKSKKFVLKVEKLHSSNNSNKEKSHSTDHTAKSTEDGWVSDDRENDGEDDDDADEDIAAICDSAHYNDEGTSSSTMSTCSSPSPRNSPKHVSRKHLKKKTSKSLKKPAIIGSASRGFAPKEGDELVTEALLVYSTATVVWQDGTVEDYIPSTQLYPIHHLDNHEFFPGDFVISAKEDSDVSFRDYGVIQTVDHQGRIAHVKWFTTYTSADEPKPTYNGESEVSVYDLKDHPDFQYRPGTMVIRVANFVGEDASCTAGQIIDNFIDGRVKVWWVDGHISMCWPQDLFEVGQYDHADWGHESDDSWETESENSEFGGSTSPKLSIAESHILSNIERARVAIARLEEIFNISPNLQNPEVMRKLLTVYKGCRYLDRLLNTSFFHEENFLGLIERVRKGGSQSISERAQDRKNRLFSEVVQSPSSLAKQLPHQQHQHQFCHYQAIVAVNSTQKLQTTVTPISSKEYAPKVLFNISTPLKCTPSSSSLGGMSGVSTGGLSGVNGTHGPPAYKRKCSPVAAARNDATAEKSVEVPTSLYNLLKAKNSPNASSAVHVPSLTSNRKISHGSTEASPNKMNPYNAEKNEMLTSAMLNIEKVFEKTSQMKSTKATTTSSQDDSGNYSRNENCDGSSTSYASSSDLTTNDTTNSSLMKANDDQKSVSCSSIELTDDAPPELVCVRLCSLLKDQLVKCINEIREKYYKEDNINLSDVFDNDAAEEDTSDTIVETTNYSCEQIDEIKEAALSLPKSPSNANEEPETVVSSASLQTVPANSLTSIVMPTTECFQVWPSAPKTHKFHLTIFHPNNTQQYYRAVQREHRMLKSALPPGVWVRVFEDRMDLLSVMIEGPKKTPYEDGMFFFDIQLGREYPKSPPLCHYISYCSDRLNPNLYEDGKVCVSLLGTWSGRDSEVWGPNSTLLQVIVSIQGLILVAEPYFNEAGYEKQKGTQQGKENSRMYNEMVIIKMVQATTKLLQQMPDIFREEIVEHFQRNGQSMYSRIKGWMELSKIMPNTLEEADQTDAAATAQEPKMADECVKLTMSAYALPDFSLVPASRGFCLTLAGLLETFKLKLATLAHTNRIALLDEAAKKESP